MNDAFDVLFGQGVRWPLFVSIEEVHHFESFGEDLSGSLLRLGFVEGYLNDVGVDGGAVDDVIEFGLGQ